MGVLRNGFDVNNKGGVIQGQRLDLRTLAGLNNNGGRIAAQSGDIVIDTASLNNRNGGLYASGLIKVAGTGASLDNTAGQLAGSAIHLDLDGALTNRGGILESDSTLVVSAASVDNQTGQLRALGEQAKQISRSVASSTTATASWKAPTLTSLWLPTASSTAAANCCIWATARSTSPGQRHRRRRRHRHPWRPDAQSRHLDQHQRHPGRTSDGRRQQLHPDRDRATAGFDATGRQGRELG